MNRTAPPDSFARFVDRARARRGGPPVVTGAADGHRAALVGHPRGRGALGPKPDGATIARAYAARGTAFLADLHGTFALVVEADDGSDLVLAIDRVGVETLCYAARDDAPAYAASADDVARELRGPHALDLDGAGGLEPQALFDYLYFHCVPGPATIYRGVERLLAGHTLRRRGGRTVVEPYWSPTYDEHRRAPTERLEREFLDLVEASVATAVDGAARPGAFLSGGTDSSTVSGLLGKVTGQPARTYSIGFDAEGFDEMEYARIAAKRFGTAHHEYYITPQDLVASIPRIAAACEQPFGNSSILPTYYCARMAEADGVDRLLGGDGGDELFGGNTRYAKQRVFGLFDDAPAPVRALLSTTFAPRAWESVPLARKVRSYVQQASVPMPARLQTYNLLTRIGVENIFEPSFLERVDPSGPHDAMRAWYARSNAASLLNRMLAFDFKYTLTDNDLPKVVTACRVAGVDVAFPFLDDDVVAFAERLEPRLKLRGLKLRWFFKHALRDFLPTEILHKSKHGFGLPFGLWLRRDPALKAMAFDSLDRSKTRGIVRPDFLARLEADLLGEHATYYGELVWVTMMLEQWLSIHAAPDDGAVSAADARPAAGVDAAS